MGVKGGEEEQGGAEGTGHATEGVHKRGRGGRQGQPQVALFRSALSTRVRRRRRGGSAVRQARDGFTRGAAAGREAGGGGGRRKGAVRRDCSSDSTQRFVSPPMRGWAALQVRCVAPATLLSGEFVAGPPRPRPHAVPCRARWVRRAGGGTHQPRRMQARGRDASFARVRSPSRLPLCGLAAAWQVG
jgi:hypothetical protein